MPAPIDSNLIILRTLLAAGDEFVSGNDLADALGMSRVSVWGRMEKMREYGFEFEAVTRKGYRLSKKPDSLNEWMTQAYIDPGLDLPSLVFLNSIDSTNSHATRLLANDFDAPFILLANEQTAGRGRLGRKWFSPPGANLYLSFAARPNVPPNRMQLFTLWMGVFIANELREWLDLPISIKWPNDLYFENKKLGGMLTEARIDADAIRELIFGMGLNINLSSNQLPDELKETATSLSALAGRPLDVNKTAAKLVQAISTAYTQFLQGGVRKQFENLWPNFDVLKGRTITAMVKNKQVEGIASGLDDMGSLILKTKTGKILTLNSGEVHIARPTQ